MRSDSAKSASSRRGARLIVEQGSAAPVSRPIETASFDFDQAAALMRELGLSRPVAVALARRGVGDPAAARDFLEAAEIRPAKELGGVDEATAALARAIAAGRRIAVFGDFDVDGVCGASIAISALRGLGADCEWLIPDRLSEGYGLRRESVERLAARGVELILTVDCGITAVEEVAAAQALGLEVIVTDHHQAAERLPDCLIVHPGVSGYETPHLCGAAVAWKLMTALGESMGRPVAGEADLDLVALATVCDLMPLTGENRSLVKRGLAVARRAGRLGLRELMRVAQRQPASLDESDLGYRLGPRINAAGRLYRADAGVELLLSEDAERAAAIAAELNQANHERRAAEQRVLGEAEAELRQRRVGEVGAPPAIVVGGEGWHPGVIGIVASRLAEAHGRPAVVITIDADGGARGSGRGVPGFDLLAAVRACDRWLRRYGGHRAACGLELEAADIPAFGAAFAEQALAQLGPEPVRPALRVDAFAAGPELGLELADELRRLAPFGIGNPAVNLLIPGAQLVEARPLGEEAKHLSLTVRSGGFRARAVAFGRASLGCDEDGRADVVVRLERNEWNGSVEPRLSLREALPLDRDGARCDPGYRPDCPEDEWWLRFTRACEAGHDLGGLAGEASSAATLSYAPGAGLAALAELLSSGAPVLAVCADAGRRAALASEHGGVGRFADGEAAICSFRDGAARFEAALAARFGLIDYRALALRAAEVDGAEPGDGDLARGRRHVALIDPPASPGLQRLAAGLAAGPGRLHVLWDEPAREFALKAVAEQHQLRPAMAAIYRALSGVGELEGEPLRQLLEGDGGLGRGPETAGEAVAALVELGLAEIAPATAADCARRLRVVSSDKKDPQSSPTFRRSEELYEAKTRFLRALRQA